MDQFDAVLAAASKLNIAPRPQRWTHLSLCVLDAVFSRGTRGYLTDPAILELCSRYAEHANLARPLVPPAEAGAVIGTPDEQPLTAFLDEVRAMGSQAFAADVLRDEQRLEPSSESEEGLLTAAVALRFAATLVTVGVHKFSDASRLPLDPGRSEHVDKWLRAVVGDDGEDVRLSYFWMLVAADDLVKPPPLLLSWLEQQLGEEPSAYAASNLLTEVAEELGCTQWELARAIWEARRRSEPVT